MTEEAKLSPQEIHEMLYDGADIVAGLRNGSIQTVKVRKIARADFSKLALLIGDDSEAAEFAEAALYCGRDEQWARSLDEASLDRVLQEGHRLNFLPFARWYRRRSRLVNLSEQQAELVRAAVAALEQIETRMKPHGSTNGSSARAIPTPLSGTIRPTS